MFELGRVCIKIAGRDAGKKCIIIDKLDDNFVMIDGQTRRRKCNIDHLEPTEKVLKISKNASNKSVVKLLNDEGIECVEKKEKKEIKPKSEKKE